MHQLGISRSLALARLPGSLQGGASQIVTRTGSNDAYAWTGHGSGSTPSVADGLNRLSSIGGSATGYDARGNLTSDPTSGKGFTYWPSDNALWTVSTPWTALSYDPLGRLALIDSAGDTGFAYDGLDMIAGVEDVAHATI